MGAKKQEQPAMPAYPHIVESYRVPSSGYVATEPYTINGKLYLKRYRITVEEVEEPVDVLQERLFKLWETEPYNSHLTAAFLQEASRLGIQLDTMKRACRAPKGDR